MQQVFKERFDGLKLLKEQNAAGKTIYKFKGPFQEMADVVGRKNKNGRRYVKKLWEKALADTDVQERLKAKRMLGELDHPTDDGQIRRTSHIITNVVPNWESGIIEGELELLDHNQGDAALLRALVDQGCELCVSSRAYGDFLDDGCTIDPETFKLVTWDIVLDPSVSIAKLNRVVESVNAQLPPGQRVNLFHEETITLQQEKDMDDIRQLLQEKTDLAIGKGKAEAMLESMKTLLQEKNTLTETLSKKLEATQKRLEELEADGNQAAELLERATAETRTLKTENTALKTLSEEAAKLLKSQTERLEKYRGIEEDAIDTIEDLTEKVKEYTGLGEKAADVIERLMEKVRKLRRKHKLKRRHREAIDSTGGPDPLEDRPLADRPAGGGPADKGEMDEADAPSDSDLDEADAPAVDPEDKEKKLMRRSESVMRKLAEAVGVSTENPTSGEEPKKATPEAQLEDEPAPSESDLDEQAGSDSDSDEDK